MQLRLPKIHFTATWAPTLAALCALGLMLFLGHWQQGRAAEKYALQAEFENRAAALPIALGADISDPLALRFFRATVRGKWLMSGQIFIDNKFDNESVGFHVITPLEIEGTNRYVLVNRGWVARGSGYPIPPPVPAPAGSVVVDGVLTLPGTRFLELSQTSIQGSVWQNLTIERYRKETGHDVLPLVLLANSGGHLLKPVLERPDARAEKHVEYMLTWYSLAATVVALWAALNINLSYTPLHSASNLEGKGK